MEFCYSSLGSANGLILKRQFAFIWNTDIPLLVECLLFCKTIQLHAVSFLNNYFSGSNWYNKLYTKITVDASELLLQQHKTENCFRNRQQCYIWNIDLYRADTWAFAKHIRNMLKGSVCGAGDRSTEQIPWQVKTH